MDEMNNNLFSLHKRERGLPLWKRGIEGDFLEGRQHAAPLRIMIPLFDNTKSVVGARRAVPL